MTKKLRRLPNGFGWIDKLPGTRRKPYRARVLVSKELDMDVQKVRKKFQTVGYAETWTEAFELLQSYHSSPYGYEKRAMTVKEVYDAWSADHFPIVSESTQKGYRAAFQILAPVYGVKFKDLTVQDIIRSIDASGKNAPTLKRFKSMMNALYKYAIGQGITDRDLSSYIDLSRYRNKNPNRTEHDRFTATEIKRLWKHTDDSTVRIILALIYSGVRIDELLSLRREDVHLDEQYFDVVRSKTDSGVRMVPIADKVLPFYKDWMAVGADTLISRDGIRPYTYTTFRKYHWDPVLKSLRMHHTPHDTRHTCASMLTEADIKPVVIKKILGHSAKMDVTEKVYTHLHVSTLLEAVNSI